MDRDKTPFSLGIEGERWVSSLPALAVPIPDSEFHFLCVRTKNGGFRILTKQHDRYVDSLLMAAAAMHILMENFSVTIGGNDESETDVETHHDGKG